MLKKLFCMCLMAACVFAASVAAAETVRTALVNGQYTAEISCDDEFVITDEATQKKAAIPAGRYFLNVKGNGLTLDKFAFGKQIAISGIKGKALPQINKNRYEGKILAYVINEKLLINNVVDVEQYVCSVLPSKTMIIWPDEVIKAQAVAARSYVLYEKARNSGAAYDISAADKELTYRGKNAEKPAISKIAMTTAGQVLLDVDGNFVQAVTTLGSGGRTEAAAEAWGRNVSYLQSVKDFDEDCPDYEWEYQVTPSLLQNFLEQRGYGVGKLESIRLSPLDDKGTDRTATGRVKYIIFSGSGGAFKVSGSELAEALGLKSILFDVETGTPLPDTLKIPIENYFGMEIGSKDIDINIDDDGKPIWKNFIRSYHMLSGGKDEKVVFKGFGSGSGIGLSVWGARGMVNADERTTYRQILDHYYPGTSISRI